MTYFIRLLAAFLAATLLSASAAAGEGLFSGFKTGGDSSPWHISADSLTYHEGQGCYSASGDVEIQGHGKRLLADFVRFCPETMEASAKGGAFLESGQDVLSADSIDLNLAGRTGTARRGEVFFHESHFHIAADQIVKTGENSYLMENAGLSTCDGENPAWKITCRSLDVTIEGYGFVKGAAFRIKGVPVLYVPFFVFPAKTKRATGLLPPAVGHSDRMGFEHTQPFFWVLGENRDATFHIRHTGERGEMFGAEYRHVFDGRSKFAARLDVLSDRKADTGSAESAENWGYDDDDFDRPNQDRYWLRAKHDQALPGGVFMKLDVDVVSDQDYLHEFKTGYHGHGDTQAYFSERFGRHIDDYNDSERISRIAFDRVWPRFGLSAEARAYDDVIQRRRSGLDETLFKLPGIRFFAVRRPLWNLPVYGETDAEFAHFYRSEGMSGTRADASARLSLPARFWDILNVEASLGLRQTVWNMENHTREGVDRGEGEFYRTVADAALHVSSELFADWALGPEGASRLTHRMAPDVSWEYAPELSQDRYPFFDSSDRVDAKNGLSYSLTHLFMLGAEKKPRDPGAAPEWETRQIGRVKMSQTWRADDAVCFSTDAESGYEECGERGFSPISLEMSAGPFQNFSATADLTWSMDGHFFTQNFGVSYTRPGWLEISAERRYSRNWSETIFSKARFQLTDRISVFARYERNLHTDENIDSGAGFGYKAQCWSVDLGYRKQGDDRRFDFKVDLAGFSDF